MSCREPIEPPIDPSFLDIASSVVASGVTPGAVLAAAVNVGGVWNAGIGFAGRLSPDGAPVQPGTRYDLASVTKPYTALVAARLHRLAREGAVMGPRLDDPLSLWVPEAVGTASANVRIELLLAHRAGLDGHRPLYEPLTRGDVVDRESALRQAAQARRATCVDPVPPEGFPPEYSDLGYLLLGRALEAATGELLGALISEHVGAWVGRTPVASSTIPRSHHVHVAPTEVVEWRGGVVQGEVHDENAWAIVGREVGGHAGLFGSASDVLALGIWLVETSLGLHDDWLTTDELDVLTRPRHGGTLRAGFDGKSEVGSSAGSLFGPRSFGHLGFTGTSLWIDPDAQLVAVLLTNRVHPRRELANLRDTRPRVHDAVARWADAVRARGAVNTNATSC